MKSDPLPSDRVPSERGPVFLARQAYFKRRVMDGARLLPVLGAGLFVMPLLWKTPGAEARMGTVEVMFFVFLCWLALVLIAFFLARRMAERPGPGAEVEAPEGDDIDGSPAGSSAAQADRPDRRP